MRIAIVGAGIIGAATAFELSSDGHDMAAALLTIEEIGDYEALHEAVADAFSGARISVANEGPRLVLQMHQPGLLRPLSAAEQFPLDRVHELG